MKALKFVMSASMTALLLSGCQTVKQASITAEEPSAQQTNVSLIGVNGQKIGSAKLTAAHDGVLVEVQASGLKSGVHGIHFHEKAACEPPNFDSAGAHFNPGGKQHGYKNPKGYHAGDLPNLIVDEQGNGKFEAFTTSVVLQPNKPNSLFKAGGTSIIIHEDPDDLKTDPSGNSGKRIACGAVK